MRDPDAVTYLYAAILQGYGYRWSEVREMTRDEVTRLVATHATMREKAEREQEVESWFREVRSRPAGGQALAGGSLVSSTIGDVEGEQAGWFPDE